MRKLGAGALLVLSLMLLSASSVAQPQSYRTEGEVRAVRAEREVIVIAHEPIEGYMPRMTMPFGVRDRAMLRQVQAGDRVSFTFRREDGRHVIQTLRVLRRP